MRKTDSEKLSKSCRMIKQGVGDSQASNPDMWIRSCPFVTKSNYTNSFTTCGSLGESSLLSRFIRISQELSKHEESSQMFAPVAQHLFLPKGKAKPETATVMNTMCTQHPFTPHLLPTIESNSRPFLTQLMCFWRIPREWARGNLRPFASFGSGTQL